MEGVIDSFVSCAEVLDFIRAYNIEVDEDLYLLSEIELIDILKGMAISFALSPSSRLEMVQIELSRCFPQCSDLIPILLESVSNCVNREVIDQLLELCPEPIRSRTIIVYGSEISDKIEAGSSIVVCEVFLNSEASTESLATIQGARNFSQLFVRFGNHLAVMCIDYVPFGYHCWEISRQYSTVGATDDLNNLPIIVSGNSFATSAVFEYTRTADELFDRLYYGFHYGGCWYTKYYVFNYYFLLSIVR